MTSTLLDYSVATDPFPLQASPQTGNLDSCVMQVIASNPSPEPDKNPVTIEGVEVTIPLGDGGSALTSDAKDIGPVAPDGWTPQTGTPAGVFAFVPNGGSAKVGAQSLVFTFNGIYVNRSPGYVQGLQVAEGSNGCQPPDCPTQSLELTKFPAGWGAVSFWVNPANIPAGQDTTLNWQGPQGAAYTIEYGTATRVVNIPAPGQPPLGNQGKYPGPNDPPLQPAQTTVFTLTVTDTIAGTQYTAQDQKTVTVQEPAPTISKFTGTVAFDPGTGACTLTFNWTAQNANYCLIPAVSANELAPSSPPAGLPFPLTAPGAESFELTAVNAVGTASSTLTLQWGITSQLGGMPGPRASVAVSHDGTLLYVAGGNTFAVYERPVVPGTAPTLQRSGTAGVSGDGFQAVVAAPNGPIIWTYAESPSGGFELVPMEDGTPPKAAGPATSCPGYGVRFKLALDPSGSPLYFSNGDAGNVYAFGVNNSNPNQAPASLGSVYTGMEAACGVAVSPQSNVYTATTIDLLSYKPGPGSPPNPILTPTGSRQITQGWDGNTMQDLAFGGGAVWVLATNWAVPCDPTSLAPLRDPIGMGADAIATTADGLRLYVITWGAGPGTLYEFAPTALTGGVAG